MTEINFNFKSQSPQQKPEGHKVKAGETLYSIAKTAGISVEDLKRANNLEGNTLSIGQILTIPSGGTRTDRNEISMMPEISDAQIEQNNTRARYIKITRHQPYTIQKGDNPSAIARKFDVEERNILSLNGLNEQTATRLQPGDVLKIPDSRHAKNINNLNDAAKAMGVSADFIKRLKRIEDGNKPDGKPFADTQFHNTPYIDDAGNRTIGIGHVLQRGEKTRLSNKEVLELFVNDMLKMEENLWSVLGGKKNYDKLPQSIKEALLDMTFNKGTAIIEDTKGLVWTLKSGKYEAAINLMTNNKTQKGKEMSGLSKRRLFDISTAAKMYKGSVPQSIINTQQKVYNHGVELLRKECALGYKKLKNPKISQQQYFLNQLAGYNKEALEFSDGKIKTINR